MTSWGWNAKRAKQEAQVGVAWLRPLVAAVPWITVGLLIVSNFVMLIAWYGHLRSMGSSPVWLVVLVSWAIALFEYSFMIPANRMGAAINGGPFNLMQLKVIQEVISLTVFTIIAGVMFQGEQLHWNHLAAFLCLIAAVYFVFMK